MIIKDAYQQKPQFENSKFNLPRIRQGEGTETEISHNYKHHNISLSKASKPSSKISVMPYLYK